MEGLCRWLYSLFLAIDANFRLKMKARGIGDPELGTGLAYFVDTIKFQKHLEDHVDEEDVSQTPLFQPHNVNSMLISIGRDLWDRVPCSKSSEFKVIKGLFGFWCWRNCLPSRPCP